MKTEYSEDEMPLDPAFTRVVQKWRMQCAASEGKWVFPNPNTGGVWHSSVLQGDILVPAGKKIGVPRLGWHISRHSYRSLLDACGAPIGVQQKLMRHAQVSTTMKYGDAYMGESGRRAAPLCRWYYPQMLRRKRRLEVVPLSVGLCGDLRAVCVTQKQS